MNQTQKTAFWLLFAACAFYAVYALRDVLLPFVAGFFIAYFLEPPTAKLEKKLHSRGLALGIVAAAAFLAVLAVLLVVLPLLERQIVIFARNIPVYAAFLKSHIAPVLAKLNAAFPQQFENVRASLAEHLTEGFTVLGGTLKRILSGSMAVLNVLSLIVITPFVAFYLLRDWELMNKNVLGLIPRAKEKTIRLLLRQINGIISGFVRGQASVCLILGVYYAVGLTLAGLDLGLLIGLFIGLICFIPYVGSTTGFLLSTGLAAVQFGRWERVIPVVVIFALGQMVEGNFLTPKLIGDKVGLHPVWVMFALLAGASLFGFLGVLIAVPVAAVAGVLVRFAIKQYKESVLYEDAADGQ